MIFKLDFYESVVALVIEADEHENSKVYLNAAHRFLTDQSKK
jgi:hypothetical protein